jgi:tRNA wybutosine-synthesizing protein 3
MSASKMPASFARKKEAILAHLSVPAGDYQDRSLKGSVDDEIRDLIDEINTYEGLVTTSSCAGRIAVFLEGEKGRGGPGGNHYDGSSWLSSWSSSAGKGDGSFLFTSHAPLDPGSTPRSLTETFQLKLVPPEEFGATHVGPGSRMIRFAFEPMILHVMAASLKHAQPLLAAAVNAGFRESGLQSLRNLHDPDACPMVAVRTAGLGVEAIIGHAVGPEEERVEEQDRQPTTDDDGAELYASENEALVTEEYLGILVGIANERFQGNKQRIVRFRTCLREAMAVQVQKEREAEAWEDTETRRQRKRKEGLRASHEKRLRNSHAVNRDIDEVAQLQELFEGQNPLQQT